MKEAIELKNIFQTLRSLECWNGYQADVLENDSEHTFLYFWSVSCGYCKEILPAIQSFYEEVKNQVKVVGVYVPICEEDLDVSGIDKVILSHKIVTPTLLDHHHDLFAIFQMGFLPSFVLIHTSEDVVDKHIGYEHVQDWLAHLHSILAPVKSGN